LSKLVIVRPERFELSSLG